MKINLPAFFFSLAIIHFLHVDLAAQYTSAKQEPVKVTFYYNAIWELTSQENAVYRREAYFDLTDLVFDGVYTDYNTKNELIADGIYDHGVKSGIQSEYVDHSVKSKIEYSGHEFTVWEWNGNKNEGVKNGSGKFSAPIFYFVAMDGQLLPKQGLLEGEFQNGRRTGRWIYSDFNNLKTDTEVYSNGKLIRHIRYVKHDSVESKESKPIYLSLNSLNTEILWFDKGSFTSLNQYFEKYVTYPVSFQRNVTYPKGLKQLLTSLANAMMVPEGSMEMIRLKIDEHGQVLKAAIVRSINPNYDALTDQIFELHKNRLLPAMRNGKPEAAVIFLPIASGEDWMRALKEAPTEWFLDYRNFE